MPSLRLMQTLINGSYSLVEISMVVIQESKLTPEALAPFDHPRPIGLSPGFSSAGTLVALAIADNKKCLIVEFADSSPSKTRRGGPRSSKIAENQQGRKLLEESILCRSTGDLFAFDMAILALSLHSSLKLKIANAVDIQSAVSGEPVDIQSAVSDERTPLRAIENVVGNSIPINKKNIAKVFHDPIYQPDDRQNNTDLAMRAWVSQFLVEDSNGVETFAEAPRIATTGIDNAMLDMLSKNNTDALHLDQLKPLETTHRFTTSLNDKTGDVVFNSVIYKEKIRNNRAVRIDIDGGSGRGGFSVPGTIDRVNGRAAHIDAAPNVSLNHPSRMVSTLTSIGRDITNAEAKRATTIRHILQGINTTFDDNPWIQNIWFHTGDNSWPEGWSESLSLPVMPQAPPAPLPDGNMGRHTPLNTSQQEAVNTMLSPLNDHRITIIQGPPGTGKTSVIASYVQLAIELGMGGIWLVAQSNVAVKNIAEKLLAVGFVDWRLLISKDFQFQWHEHLYTKLGAQIIRSDSFTRYPQHKLKGCQVILSTISMLSSPFIGTFIGCVPVKALIVDEASQIEIGNYISVFTRFQATLRKVCFIGDDKQLPPFGEEDVENLESIFEKPHLRKHALFLDTQYRMPPQIGSFISKAVYDGQLNSNPRHPITDSTIACHFIHIPSQQKRTMDSFSNPSEAEAALLLAKSFQTMGYKYQLITPYEGQRTAIEMAMQAAGLDWGNKCFTVDSFQGNEEDYIIISLVRSRELGFLKDFRRTNVMLTRCKRGMFIVSSQDFIKGVAAKSLVGQLAQHVGDKGWLNLKDVEEGNF